IPTINLEVHAPGIGRRTGFWTILYKILRQGMLISKAVENRQRSGAKVGILVLRIERVGLKRRTGKRIRRRDLSENATGKKCLSDWIAIRIYIRSTHFHTFVQCKVYDAAYDNLVASHETCRHGVSAGY